MKKILKIIDYFIISLLVSGILTFILYPFLKIFIYSFFSNGRFSMKGFEFLRHSGHLIGNSLYVGITVTVLTAVVSVSIGLFCYMSSSIVKRTVSFILMITMISPPFVSALSYIKLFGRRGFITYNIFRISADAYGMGGVVLMQSIGLISLSALIIISSLDNIDRAQIDSARSLGAGTDSIIMDIILPELSSSIKVIAVLAFIRSIADFSTPLIIGGAFETLASRSYTVFISDGDILQAGAMNILLCVPVIIAFIFYIRNSGTMVKADKGLRVSEAGIKRKGALFWIFTLLTGIFMIFLILQYASIILSAFIDYNKGKMFLTLNHIWEIGNYTNNTVFRSIYYSFLAAFTGSILGLLLQYYIHIRGKKYLKIVDFIATMPYMLPGTFFGIGYILAFNHEPINIAGTALIVILNITFKQLPFSTKIFHISMANIDKNEILSGKDLGADEYHIFKDIVFPASLEEFLVSMINNFNATMTTVGSIIFIVYPSQKVLTLVMFDVINSGKYDIASVIALLIITICICFSMILLGIRILIKNRRGYVFRS